MDEKILVFAGSTREGSYNKKLARLAAEALKKMDAQVTFLDLVTIPMPLYDGDLESQKGIPENGMKFRALLKDHAAFLMICPEYNSSISGVLKNSLDWASRPVKGDPELVCFKNKIVSLMSASPSRWGGLRGLVTVRSILGNIGSIVLPDQLCVSFADKAFDENDQLIDTTSRQILQKQCKYLFDYLQR